MSCDCIRRLEKMLTEEMVKRYPDWEVEEKVKFTEKELILDSKGAAVVLGNPVLGRVRRGKQIRKFETQILPQYCPFCGKKKTEGGEE